MRVIAGFLRHRKLEMTNLKTTRETQDSVREAIFNMIGPYFAGGIALDLFAGSGAMGIEAFSRGIKTIYLNDINPLAIDVCKKNCSNLAINEVHFSSLDYQIFLRNNDVKFDLIILDPPYKLDNIEEILKLVEAHLVPNGQIVFEIAKDSKYIINDSDLEIVKNKVYGIKRVVIYQKK